jgi:hypothetical protein
MYGITHTSSCMHGVIIAVAGSCVTAGRRLRIQVNLPEVPIHAPVPLVVPRAKVAKAKDRKNDTRGNKIRAVRKSRKP